MTGTATYGATRDRVEHYFDRTATRTWERLTSDAPVSKIRQTVREGRDAMRELMLSRLPDDLRGARILDAGCGPGVATAELARRGANVVAVDISPQLVGIARARLPEALAPRVTFATGDMLDVAHGRFDAVFAMDSLIYYGADDLVAALDGLAGRTDGPLVFTVAPKTAFLTGFWMLGQLFPRSDRSPTMVPHDAARLMARFPGLSRVDRISRGFYISECLEVRP